MSIGDRLKAERERVGLTIAEFGDVAGAKKNTVIDWQNDVSSPPAAKLAALAEAGVDVTYVITGYRGVPVQAQEPPARYSSDAPAVVETTPVEMDADIRTAIAMVADELRSQHKVVSGAQFVDLVERARRYIRQGRELERKKAAQNAARRTPSRT